jgi:hypothetical protein
MTTDFSKFKKQELSRPMDAAWGNGFMKFEKEGDKVEGVLRDVFYKVPEGIYKAQRGFTLELADGSLKNVGIKREPYFAIRPTDNVRLGDLLTVELVELRKNTKGNPTKIYSFTAGTLPENAGNKTVKELEAADMPAGEVDEVETEDTPEEVPFD